MSEVIDAAAASATQTATEPANIHQAAAAATPPAVTTATSPSTADAATSSDSFDTASIEEAFGLPAGTLKDVTDMDSALGAVRDFTDKVTVAGMGAKNPLATPPAAATPAPAKQAGQPATTIGESEKQYLTRAEVDVIFAEKEAARNKEQTDAMLVELDRRLDAEIDSWASPKYGVGKQRTVKQIKAHDELKDMIVTHIAGAAATNQTLPVGEVIARRVRLLDDESYKPTAAGAATVPLGTPGAAKAATAQAKEGPRNIHEAVLGRRI